MVSILHQYKNNKLKTVKILRQPFAYPFFFFFSHGVKYKKSLENLFNIYGIMKFIILILVLKNLINIECLLKLIKICLF